MGSSGTFTTSAAPSSSIDTFTIKITGPGGGFQTTGKLAEYHGQANLPSWATFTIPITNIPHQDFAADGLDAFKSSTGPRLNMRGIIYHCAGTRAGTPLLIGQVVDRWHDPENDTVSFKINNDLYLLSKFTIYGAYTLAFASESALGELCFDPSIEAIFNRFSQPNCMDTEDGPVFAPVPRYGWTAQDVTEPVPGKAVTRARSWRTGDAAAYICRAASGGFEPAIKPDKIYNTTRLPDEIKTDGISESLTLPAGAIDQTSSEALSSSQRILSDLKADGKNMLVILREIGTMAGPFELHAVCEGSVSRITYVYQGAGYAKTKLKAGGVDTTTFGFQAGTVTETAEKYHDKTTIIGGCPFLESQVSTDCGQVVPDNDAQSASIIAFDLAGGALGGTTDIRNGSLKPAWTEQDEIDFWTFVYDNSTISNSATVPLSIGAAYQLATRIWPLVGTAYKVSTAWNFLRDTKYTTYTPNLSDLPREIRPALLSGIKVRNDPGSPTFGEWRPYEITIECLIQPGDPASTVGVEDTSNVWEVATRSDKLTLSKDKTYFMLDGLRDSAKHPTWRGNPALMVDAFGEFDISSRPRFNHIRATIAIKCPFRLIGKSQLDNNKTGGRVVSSIPTEYVGAPSEDYIEWLRINSYPFGKRDTVFNALTETDVNSPAIGAYGKLPDNCEEGYELFSDAARIQLHASARQNRVRKVYANGQISSRNFEPGLVIGSKVQSINDLEVGGTLSQVHVTEMDQHVSYTFQ